MVQPITLTDDETTLLKQHYAKAQSLLIRERAHCVLLSHQGRGTRDISEILMREQETIHGWILLFHTKRIASIFPGYAGNENASKLTREQRAAIAATIATPPSTTGLPVEFWSITRLKKYVTATYDVVYESERSYHHLFALACYSFKKPSPFDRRRDDAFVRKRLKAIRKEIKPYLASDDWVVLTADEVRVSWETEIRRAWLPRGKPTVLKVNRTKIGQSYFGALDQKTGQHHCIPVPWQTSDDIADALETIIAAYPTKKICIIWDNASWHRGQKLRERLGPGHSLERVRLVNLPPYAPDENPEEHVWKVGKDAIANTAFDTFDRLKEQFVSAVTTEAFSYKI